MAKVTIAFLQAKLAAEEARSAGLQTELDFFKSNSKRKEGVIQMLQGKVQRLENQLRGSAPGTNVTNWAEIRKLSALYCAKHGVKSCTIPQALSLKAN